MNKKEKIRRYIEGEMSGNELKSFGDEINNSPLLKKEIDAYRDTLNQFNRLKDVKAEDEYFKKIITRFNERKSGYKYLPLKPSFALGSVIIILIAVALIFVKNDANKELKNDELTLQDLNQDELNEYLTDNSGDILMSPLLEDVPVDYDSVFNSIVKNELNLEDYSDEYFVISNVEIYNVLNELSEEEIEEIYINLIKEDFN